MAAIQADLRCSCVVASSIRLYYMVVFRQQYQERLDDFPLKIIQSLLFSCSFVSKKLLLSLSLSLSLSLPLSLSLAHRYERQHHHLGRNRTLHLHNARLPSIFGTPALGHIQETRHVDVLVTDGEESRATGCGSAADAA